MTEEEVVGHNEGTRTLTGTIQKGGGTLTTDFEWSFQLQEDWLTKEDFPGLDTEATHLSLCHLDNLPWTTSSHWWRKRRHRIKLNQVIQAFRHKLARQQ